MVPLNRVIVMVASFESRVKLPLGDVEGSHWELGVVEQAIKVVPSGETEKCFCPPRFFFSCNDTFIQELIVIITELKAELKAVSKLSAPITPPFSHCSSPGI